MLRSLLTCAASLLFLLPLKAEDGSRLWLRQEGGANGSATLPSANRRLLPTLRIAADELRQAWRGAPVRLLLEKNDALAPDGFRIRPTASGVTISSATPAGVLYGAYRLLALQAMETSLTGELTESPAYDLRILNHWDNLDRTVERGYAGRSLWDWEELTDSMATDNPSSVTYQRYVAYARANASIGINGTVLNNVNASPQILTRAYLHGVKRLADIFRPYGLRVYLSVNFASPMALGELSTADPLDEDVRHWWKAKADEIYRLIPDFGGFLVKANSEGQPGPCDFGRTHAEGANMLADALAPHRGTVMWRAFVYSPTDADRAKQAYLEFQPLDGQFRPNVIIQVKNGPIDFQPREPYSPLFGAMPRTPLMAELQVTQEYLGHANHLAFLAPMWREFFDLVPPASLRAVAGVANIGTDDNWCGHPFAAANWYAFGRLAWNPALGSEAIANEWLRQTFGTDEAFVAPISQLMLESREAVVDYMMPLGLHHIFAWGHHYGPEPWCDIPGARPDWLPPYYHRADSIGIGFDRTRTGSDAVSQYPPALAELYNDPATCPEHYLLWFHHLPWNYAMKSGRTLWDELCRHYDRGVRQTRGFQQTWDAMKPYVDPDRFADVQARLRIQARDATWWRDACLLYFQTFARQPIPYDLERPIHGLDELKQVQLPIGNHECPDEELLNKYR
ncbi:MAG: alpha-glucuronidase [Mediterranea sp.]|jgi:alpha-glucuronidase|nr:alpha-glucuronidase [Mediterranea sp.]